MMTLPILKPPKGFSLIELVVVMVIIAIMGAAMLPVVKNTLLAYDTVQGNVAVLDKLRYATERLAREIREVNDLDTSDAGTNFAINMSTTAPVFTRNYMSCTNATCSTSSTSTATITVGATCPTGYTAGCVTLADSSNAAGAQVLVDQVQSLTFAYYDANGCLTGNTTAPCTGTVDATNVRSVEISLTLRVNGSDYTQKTRAQLKNL